MIFGAILAGGIGTRMGNVEKPKQFLMIGKKPVIIHTLEKFYINNKFQKIIVLTPSQWVVHTKDLVNKYFPDTEKIVVINGGATRNETIMEAIKFIEDNYALDDNTKIITHDAVRPFVTTRIIEENITALDNYAACDTVIDATDTIVESIDGKIISSIPERKKMFQGQTPQSFHAKRLKELYYSLSKDDKEILTDAAKIFVIKGELVSMVEGEVFNIKITNPYDLKIAKTLASGEDLEC